MSTLIEILQLIASLATIAASAAALVGLIVIWPTAQKFNDFLFEFEGD